MREQKLKVRDGIGGSSGETDVINAANEVLVVDVSELTNVQILAIQSVDAGAVVMPVEKTYDGTIWVPVGADLTEASFTTGANTAVERTLSDANGMPTHAQK